MGWQLFSSYFLKVPLPPTIHTSAADSELHPGLLELITTHISKCIEDDSITVHIS